MKTFFLKLSSNAKRLGSILGVVLLLIQIPNQGITLLEHYPVLQRIIGVS
jgi:hypothetical protein